AEIEDLEVLLEEVTPDPPPPSNPNYSGDSGVVQFAYDQLGEPYVYGSGGPDSWDCSGLVQGAWASVGVSRGFLRAMAPLAAIAGIGSFISAGFNRAAN